MEFLAMLYTVLLVAICLMMALLLFRSGRPTGGLDEADCEELKDWLEEQLAAQAREFNARQDAIAQQNYAAIRSVSETLQTAVQSMSTTLGQGQDSQQRILERRLQSLEQANNQQMEQLRRAMVESMTALQAENTRKLDEIRHTVDEQLQDALQKRVTESFKAVNQQLEQVYKGLGEMQSLAADVGGLKQVLSGARFSTAKCRSRESDMRMVLRRFCHQKRQTIAAKTRSIGNFCHQKVPISRTEVQIRSYRKTSPETGR